jgi:hypothetical protein
MTVLGLNVQTHRLLNAQIIDIGCPIDLILDLVSRNESYMQTLTDPSTATPAQKLDLLSLA